MEIHYTKHHQAYVDNLNKAIAGTDLEGKTIEEVIKEGSDKTSCKKQWWWSLQPYIILGDFNSGRIKRAR